jgi:hypothetical protein
MDILYIEPFCPQKNAQESADLRLLHTSSTVAILTIKTASEYAHARLQPELS